MRNKGRTSAFFKREKKHEMELYRSFTHTHALCCRVQRECTSSDLPICTPSWVTGVSSLRPVLHPVINHIVDSPGGLGASAGSRVLWWDSLDTAPSLHNTTALK